VPRELEGANLTENAARLVIQNKATLDKGFLADYLSSAQGQFEIHLRATKTSQPKLALSRIKQIPMPLPPRSDQDNIVHVLRCIVNKLAAERDRKSALEALFHSLLHHLMTGQVRVPREYWIEDT